MEQAEDQCYYIQGGLYCNNKQDASSAFCSNHKREFAPLDNPALIEQAARTRLKLMYVNDQKQIVSNSDAVSTERFENIINELCSRGYTEEEAEDAVGTFISESGLFDELNKKAGRDPKWKRFEKITAGIHMLIHRGAVVKFNDSIKGKRTGRDRQVDVSIRTNQGFYDYLTVIECKDKKRRVEMEEVEAFNTKRLDLDAQLGIMVSPVGFQEGAKAAAASGDSIRLFTLTEVKSDWVKILKADVLSLPFPSNIEFDHPSFDIPNLYKTPRSLAFDEIICYVNQQSSPILLDEIVRDMAKWAYRNQLVLPCKVEKRFDPPLLTKFPSTKSFNPIFGITVTLTATKVAIGREIDIPPKLLKYTFSDIAKERIHEFPAGEVPEVD